MMRLIPAIVTELFGLFVDDGALALQVLGLVGAVTAWVKLGGLAPLLGAGLLVIGCIGILIASVLRRAKA